MSDANLCTLDTGFIRCISAALKGETVKVGELCGVDAAELFKLSDSQRMLPLVYEALKDVGAAAFCDGVRCGGEKTCGHRAGAAAFGGSKNADGEAAPNSPRAGAAELRGEGSADAETALLAAGRDVRRQVAAQAVKNEEFRAVYKRLEALCPAPPAILKGQLLDEIYPFRDHRLSGDDDLLAPGDEYAACRAALEELGLECAAEDEAAGEAVFAKRGSPLKIELHKSCFAPDEALGERLNEICKKYGADFRRYGDFSAPEESAHLLYLALHAYNHFSASGVGLRQVCDICLWYERYKDSIDTDILCRGLYEAGAVPFFSAVLRIGRDMLGIDAPIPEAICGVYEKTDAVPLLRDILDGGVFGTAEKGRAHAAGVTQNAAASGRVSIAKTLFPPYGYMKKCYPFLKKCPPLLPAAWVGRIFGYLFSRKEAGSARDDLKNARRRTMLINMYTDFEKGRR